MSDPLESFSPAVRVWFRETFGEPTPPQAQGWPPIQRGEHTLILAPTGSGKTLAAFLWGIDELYRELSQEREPASESVLEREKRSQSGVRLLYISPLKALNNDIERNLRAPLEGIRSTAVRMGGRLPALRVAVRTGDTPGNQRAQMLKQPPHILITTPESLYLMLTSPRAREMFRSVRSVIVDEIHTLCGDKRGVHLALSLERLGHLAEGCVQRIGLSATVKPLEEAARFLGGQDVIDVIHDAVSTSQLTSQMSPRPVTVVDAHYPKALDLKVITVVEDFRDLPGDTIWPSVIPQVLADMYRHHTTLIFANNRRLAERTADRLNAQLAAERNEEIPPGSTEALAPGGIARDRGIFAIGAEGPIRAHHGSMSKEARRKMEEDLKAGRLPALVGTSSLELGIDIGAVDLVVQLQSPKSVTQGLQRVGRSGHLVGQTSKGRIYATFREDLLEAAAIARGMLDRDVEPTYTPQTPLDVLAQQIVAMAAMEDWSAPALFEVVRQAYPYRDLSLTTFRSVLDMLAGKYYLDAPNLRPASSLRAKIAWDRVHDRLSALPGSRLLAMSNVGTIPDTGTYGAYLSDGKTKIGELDEEFVFETRVGDTFLLGSKVWRVTQVTDDRVIVADAAGATPRMPFWNGEYPYRPYELGMRIGRFRRQVVEKLKIAPPTPSEFSKTSEVLDWLMRDYALDANSARNLVEHVQRQLDAIGVMSSDTTIVVESFQNAVGDLHWVIHSPFGGRVNGAWALALTSALHEQTGVTPEMQANDDGIIFRFPQSDREPPVEIVSRMTAQEAKERILRELPTSAVFGGQFRMNAARALLLPRARGRKRTPFWLQRLKAKDLLALVSRFDDFPIVTETYRDCLRDIFDLPHLEEVLSRIQTGEIRVVPIETATPSPIAASLLFNFAGVYLYEWDAPKSERQLQALSLPREALADVLKDTQLSDLLKPEAIAEVAQRAQHRATGFQSRMLEELALMLLELGDLTTDEIVARCAGDGRAWIQELRAQERAIEIRIGDELRWAPVELADEYRTLAGPDSAEKILRRFLSHTGPVTREMLLARYPFSQDWLDATLARLVELREVVRGRFTGRDQDEYCDANALEQIHRRTLTLLRKEVQPVSLYAYADFLARWQHAHPDGRLHGLDGLRRVVEQLRGVSLPGVVWERDVLPARIATYDADLDALSQGGDLVWVGSGRDPKRGGVRLLFRGEGNLFLPPFDGADLNELNGLSLNARAAYDYLKSEGASFLAELQSALKLKSAELNNALVELVMVGLVTNDSIDALRRMLADSANADAARERRPMSSLEEELGQRMGTNKRMGMGQRPSASRYREARRRVTHRLRETTLAQSSPTSTNGRWSLVYRAGVMGLELPSEERAERLARVLLARYGILTRECLVREELGWEWSHLYPVLERMEMRGEVRRGYFVAGLSGAQFALPDAVEQLRASSASSDEIVVVLNATDPANVFGSDLADAPRFARVPSTHIALVRGQPVAIFEDNGERVTTTPDVVAEVIQRALAAYIARPNAPRHIVVSQWNGEGVTGSPGQRLLKALGFSHTPTGMEWWAGDHDHMREAGAAS